MKIRFNKKYGLCSVGLILIGVLLMFWIKDAEFNRNVGNVVFVILIYCLLLTFVEINKKATIIGIGVFALIFEVSKIFGWVKEVGLSENFIFSNLLGDKFNFDNVWSYVAGCAMIWLLEFYKDEKHPRKRKFLGF